MTIQNSRGGSKALGVFETRGPAGPRTRAHWTFALDRLGMLPVLSEELMVVTEQDGDLIAVERSNGKLRWRIPGSSFRNLPQGLAVDHEALYMVTPEGLQVHALDDGAPLWALDIGQGQRCCKLPMLVDGALIVGTEWNATLCRVDLDTRSVRWSHALGQGHIRTSVSQGRVFFTIWGSPNQARPVQIGCCDLDTGKMVWQTDLPEEGSCTAPTVGEAAVFLGARLRYLALDVQTGAQLWEHRVRNTAATDPVYWQGKVYVGDLDAWVYCLDASDASVLWKTQTESSRRRQRGIDSLSLSTLDARLYAGCRSKKLFAFDAHTGGEAWSAKTPGSVAFGPIPDDGVLYYSTHYPKGALVARR